MPQSTNLWEGNHLSGAALAQYQQGNLPSDALLEADAHLASCGECKVRLNQLVNRSREANTSIVSLAQALAREELNSPLPHLAPYVADFPSFDTIAHYVDGKLSAEQSAAFEVALARFPSLVKQIEDLRALRDELNTLSGAETAEAETLVVPPMIVRPPVEAKATRVVWWRRLLWPMQTLGTVAVSALFFAVIWSQQNQISLNHQQLAQKEEAIRQQQQQVAQRDGQIAKVQGEKRSLQSKQQKTAQRLNASERRVDELQAKSEELRAQIEEKKRQLRAAESRNAQSTPEPVAAPAPFARPSPAPSSAASSSDSSESSTAGWNEFILELRDPGLLQTAPVARGGGGSNPKFQTLSPVATKVRALRPLLRWTPLKGATEYRIALNDETEEEWVFESESVGSTPWRIPQQYELKAGHRYRWEITALAAGKVIGVAPQAPAGKALFEVLSAEENQMLQQKLTDARNSRKKQIVALAKAGLTGEALEKWLRLRNGE